MIENSFQNSINIINNQNIQNDASSIRKIQHNLIMMGFDIIMINKIISIYKIKTENEALDYLIKTDDGMWNHPFIPKLIEYEDNNSILKQPKVMMNSMITRINSLNLSNSITQIPQIQNSNINKNITEDIDEIKINEEICEICGESKNYHKIKEYKNLNEDNSLYNNNNLIISSNNNILIEEEKDLLLNNNEDKKSNVINNNQIENKEKDNKEEIINENECLICMGNLENPVEIEKCKHKFCRECLNSYLVDLINNNRIDKISCPKNNCANKELTEEFFSQYLSEQEYFKFRQFRAQNEIARDKKKIFCPLCDSYASIKEGTIDQYDSNNPNYKKTTLKCKKGHEFCSCGRTLHENDCYHDGKEFKDFLTEEKIKKCPKCGFLIKKNKGCNHMTCGNPICRYEFCWLCMKEAVPNHFEFGPCAGKQFFNPESFSYKLQQNYPFLYCIYSLFECLFTIIFILIGLFVLPGIGLSFICYEIIFESDALNEILKKKYLKLLQFLNCFCISFCIESIIYIIWTLIFSALGCIISLIIIYFIYIVVKNILKCLICCWIFDNKKRDISDDGKLNDKIIEDDGNNNNV